MEDADLTGDPIFVDVRSGQQAAVNEFIIFQQPQGSKDETEAEVSVLPPTTSMTSETLPVIPTDPVITKRLRCPQCQRYTADSEEKILRHIRSYHQGENPFQCSMCDYSTYNKSLFEEHVRIHQGIKPFQCSKCPYRSASKKNTKKHELIHRPDNPLLCAECGFIARNPQALKHHQKMHTHNKTGQSMYTCPYCLTFKCSTSIELRTHRHNRKKCPDCDFVGCSQKSLNHHLADVHDIVKKKEKQPVFKCGLCKWSSSTKTKILLHLIHHPNQVVDEDVIDISVLRQCGIMT